MITEQQFVACLVGKSLSDHVLSVARVSKGITNRVFKVRCAGGAFACRLNDSGRTLKSYESNARQLNQLGVKTASVITADYSGQAFGIPFQILEWIDGQELDEVIAHGSRSDIERFALAVADALKKTRQWEGTAYGYMTSGEWIGSNNWVDVTRSSISRAKESLGAAAGAAGVITALTSFADRNYDELAAVPSMAYIDDWHFQNVFLTQDGLVGIDVDSIAFGDVRDLVGRSLWRFRDKANGKEYVDLLLGHFKALAKRPFVAFYAALFGCYAPDIKENATLKMEGLFELCSEFDI